MTVVPDARGAPGGGAPGVPAPSVADGRPAPATRPVSASAPPSSAPPQLPPPTSFRTAFGAVYRGQLARSKVGRIPLLFVASFQSVGILVLLRGILDVGDTTAAGQVVAGSTVLVVAFVALNLLAQRFGALRAAGALDYYLTLPVPGVAVVLGTAASYATFAAPGTVVTAVLGALLYGLPLSGLWLLLPVVALAGICLSGLGAAIGLLAPRPELATVAGQLGMSIVLFFGVIPSGRLPEVGRWARDALPSSYAVDALAAAFQPGVDWAKVVLDLGICAAVGMVALSVAAMALRRVGTS
ncbi:ABC transporter permease [Frankia sp. B2]|uniref:ABC transporter permease n=1 Tax=Frankia TaxID=1854 RepID=UPI0002DA85CD|nr:ABC transporter permease [Frankia sp. B2]